MEAQSAVGLRIALLAVSSALLSWASAGPGKPSVAGAPFILAMNTSDTTYDADDPVPAVLCMGYVGAEEVWIVEGYAIVLLDMNGARVAPKGRVQDPLPPPADHFMVGEDGRPLYATPLRELTPQEGTITVLADALARYRPLEPGSYVVLAEAGISVYGPERPIDRSDENLSHKIWAGPKTPVRRLRLASNRVEITIK